MKKLSLLQCLVSTLILATCVNAQTIKLLSPLAAFGPIGDGIIRPGDRTYLTGPVSATRDFQRGFAYDPVKATVILIDRLTNGNGIPLYMTGDIYVLNGTNGNDVAILPTRGTNFDGTAILTNGDFVTHAVAVADDGAVYVCDLVNSSANKPFKIYRWESSTTTNDPVVAYEGNPGGGQSWGNNMDVRGAGPNTQIIVGSRTAQTAVGTNVAVFTTANGTNFTPTVLSIDAPENSFGLSGGIAFGAGNTFWGKNLNMALRHMAFDLSSGAATTLQAFDTNVLAASANWGPIAVDAANNLLATINFVTGADEVRLYDISNLAKPPVLLDVKINPSSTRDTTVGFMDFGGGNLYLHDMNNGILAYSVGSAAMPAPTFLAQPASQRVVVGLSARFEVLASPGVTYYQWRKGAVNILNATNAVYTIPSVTTNDAATYSVVVSNASGSLPSDGAVLAVVNIWHLSPRWSAAPASQLYVTSTGGSSTPNERAIAYNALSNQLYVVQNSKKIYVVDADTGAYLYMLNNTTISGGSILLIGIAVADDGAIYACNETATSASINWNLSRWANSHSNTVPLLVYSGNPPPGANLRWGDVMAVRGTGTNTQVLLDSYSTTPSPNLAVFTPTDEYCTNFTGKGFMLESAIYPTTPIGRSIQFGTGNTCWQKRYGLALLETSFDLTAPDPAAGVNLVNYAGFPATLGPCGIDLARNLLAALKLSGTVGSAPDSLSLYELSDPNVPVLLASYNFPANKIANANGIGQVLFGGANYVFALEANNGIVAFQPVFGPPGPPVFTTEPSNLRMIQGGGSSLSVITDDATAKYQWRKGGTNVAGATKASLTFSNAQFSDAATYLCVATNLSGATTSSVAWITVTATNDTYRLTPLWSLAPLDRTYLPADGDSKGQTPLYRGIAYNALSNQVYVISRTSATLGLTINVLDAATGVDLYQLNTDGITNGSIVLLAMGVAADGSLYAANEHVSSGTTAASYRLYRWTNSAPTTPPVLVYEGEPANQITALRWGDNLDVRGVGTNTEVLIDANQGTFAAVLKPADGSLNSFTNAYFTEVGPNSPIGRTLQFGPANTMWQKRSGLPLRLSSYDLASQSSTLLTTYANFPTSLGPVALDSARNLLAGVNIQGNPITVIAPDTVALYEMSDLNAPMLIAKYNFPTNANLNDNKIAQVIFAGNRVYAVDSNNGIAAFDLVPPVTPQLAIVPSGGNVIISWPTSASGGTLKATPTLTSPTWTNVGTGTIVGTNYFVTNSAAASHLFYRLYKN